MNRSSVVIAVVLLASGCSASPSGPLAAPTSSAAEPSTVASATGDPSADPTFFDDIEPGTELAPGDYVLRYSSIGGSDAFPTLAITFTVPANWSRVRVDGLIWNDNGTRVGILVADNLYIDPCDPGQGLREPAVGPSVADLANALATIQGWEVVAKEEVSFAGFGGMHVELIGPTDVSACADEASLLLHTLGSPGYAPAISDAERHELWILNVEGTRLIIEAVSKQGVSPANQAQLQAVVDSIVVTP